MLTMASIGDRIKGRREALNLSQDDLAQKVGYKSRSSINKIELGKTDISQSKIQDFADSLETTPAYLMGWDDGKCFQSIIIKEKTKETIKETYERLLEYISILNNLGEEEAIKRVEELTHLPKYTDKESE